MAAIFFRCFATLVLALLVVVAAQEVQANDPTTEGLSNSTRQLFKAINENDLESARAAVTQGAAVGAENSLGVRPVDLAVDLGHFEVAHFLLSIHQAPAPKQEEIPLPPPVTPLPALTPPKQISPPVLSGPQFAAPVFKSVPQPAIAPLAISPPVISPPAISSPQIPAQPRIAAPRFSPPAIKVPTLPIAPEPSAPTLGAPSIQAIPAPPKLSLAPPPVPPALTNEDGSLVRTPEPRAPKPMPAPNPTSAITATAKAAKGIATAPAVPKIGVGGFMSNVWDSMIGWVPFTGDNESEKVAPAKQIQPSRPTQVTPDPVEKKIPAPVFKAVREAPTIVTKEIPAVPTKKAPAPATTASDTPKKPEKGFFSSAWDSLTDWVPFTGDNKGSSEDASPTHRRLPILREQSSKAPATQETAALQSTPPERPEGNINDEVEASALAFAIAYEQKNADLKTRQEKAAAAAKQRAEAELAPPPKPKPEPKIDPVAEQDQAAADFKKRVQHRKQIAAGQKSQTPVEPRAPVESKLNSPPLPEQPDAKESVFAKIGHFFKRRWDKNLKDRPETETAKIDPTVKDEASVVHPPEKIFLKNETSVKEPTVKASLANEFPENKYSEDSASYANLPLPAPPPPVQAISISQNVNLVVGAANSLGQELTVELVEESKCVEKTEQNILFCLERVVWPDPIRKILKSPLSFMGDDMAMIRYDGGKASQFHINFPTERFDRLINYFEKKYGPPTEYPKLLMHQIGAPPKENPTVRWRVANPAMGRDVILEIRRTDDLRSILPADGTGVVRLYSAGDKMIFRYVSTADIMLMRMKYSTTRRTKIISKRRAERRNQK